MMIHLNISEAFHNKENLTGNKSAFGFSFHPVMLTLPQMVKHIRTGKAFTIGYFEDNRRIESHFVSSQLLALDLDQCQMSIDMLEDSSVFIQDYAFMMYPTPSSTPEQPKTRILFILDTSIDGMNASKRWRALQLGLMDYFAEVKPDEACKDPSRLFYGCETKDYYVNYEARLPLSLAANLIIPQAERDEFSRLAQHYTVQYHREDTDLQRCAVNFLNHALKKVSAAGQGSKHITFRNYALWLYGLNLGQWPISRSDIENGLTAIATAWGDNEKTIQSNLKWASEHCTAVSIDEARLTPRGAHALLLQRKQRYGGQL
jgi:hypothetical protein